MLCLVLQCNYGLPMPHMYMQMSPCKISFIKHTLALPFHLAVVSFRLCISWWGYHNSINVILGVSINALARINHYACALLASWLLQTLKPLESNRVVGFRCSPVGACIIHTMNFIQGGQSYLDNKLQLCLMPVFKHIEICDWWLRYDFFYSGPAAVVLIVTTDTYD